MPRIGFVGVPVMGSAAGDGVPEDGAVLDGAAFDGVALDGVVSDGVGAADMTSVVVAWAWGPPLRLSVWPVNTRVVDVPPELVRVTLTGNEPGFGYVCVVVGVVVIVVVPSPKSQA